MPGGWGNRPSSSRLTFSAFDVLRPHRPHALKRHARRCRTCAVQRECRRLSAAKSTLHQPHFPRTVAVSPVQDRVCDPRQCSRPRSNISLLGSGRSSDFRVRATKPSRTNREGGRAMASIWSRGSHACRGMKCDSSRLQRRGRPGISPVFPVCGCREASRHLPPESFSD